MDKEIMKRYDNNFYKMMAEHFGGEIFVTDGEGVVLFVNLEAVNVIGRPIHEIVGRNVRELEAEGFFKPSVTLEVLRRKEQADIIQEVNGKKVLCTGTPIFDDTQKNIRMVISTTRDVKAFSQLYESMEQQKEELSNLRDMVFEAEGFVTGSSNEEGLKAKLLKLANLDVPILLTGETGVGKGVAARAIHSAGKGRNKAMIKINCGIIPEHLIESELFGYERGAFTGAERSGKKGKVEMAEGGTLFLDEIGEMPLSLQVKLLDFLQDGTFTRVGGTKEHRVNTRIIAATNRDLVKMCREGLFRQDLYYRINAMPLEIPPLREREEDMDALIRHFMSQCNRKYNARKELSDKAWETMKNYSWPGNIRELEHVIERLYVMTDGDIITEKDLKEVLHETAGEQGEGTAAPQLKCTGLMPLKDAKWELERQLVSRAYEEFSNTYKVAHALKIDQSTVVKLLKKHDIKVK